jgi:hypothetical protein
MVWEDATHRDGWRYRLPLRVYGDNRYRSLHHQCLSRPFCPAAPVKLPDATEGRWNRWMHAADPTEGFTVVVFYEVKVLSFRLIVN